MSRRRFTVHLTMGKVLYTNNTNIHFCFHMLVDRVICTHNERDARTAHGTLRARRVCGVRPASLLSTERSAACTQTHGSGQAEAARLARVARLLRDSPSTPCPISASISRLRLHACCSTVQAVCRVIAATNQSSYESQKLGGLVRRVCCLLL